MLFSAFTFFKSALGYSPGAKFAAFRNEDIVFHSNETKQELERE